MAGQAAAAQGGMAAGAAEPAYGAGTAGRRLTTPPSRRGNRP